MMDENEAGLVTRVREGWRGLDEDTQLLLSNVVGGVVLGASGRVAGGLDADLMYIIPGLPPTMATLGGGGLFLSRYDVASWTAYAVGVASAYADKAAVALGLLGGT